ncbi:MAG: hypothetical protein ACRDH5_01335 [bacterium]
MNRIALVLALAAIALTPAARSHAETVGTLTLDSLSFVSFQDEQVLPLTGGTVTFHFGTAQQDGSIPFSIGPGDVSIPEISLASGERLRYGLASTSSGRLRPSVTGHIVEFDATVTATLTSGEESGTLRYPVPFTTETVSAQSGAHSVSVTGVRIVPAVRYTQLVGATVNKPDAVPKPGTAVYTVLSGSFDRLP